MTMDLQASTGLPLLQRVQDANEGVRPKTKLQPNHEKDSDKQNPTISGPIPSTTNDTVLAEEQKNTLSKKEASTDPLQFLSELAAQRSTIEFDDSSPMNSNHNKRLRSPKRVSLSPTHFKRHKHDASSVVDDARFPHLPPMQPKRVVTGASPSFGSASNSSSSLSSSPSDSSSSTKQTSATEMSPRKPFEERYLELQAFKARFGHVDVLTTGEYKGLGRWITNLRSRFRNGSLSITRAKLLQNLGCSGFDPSDMNASEREGNIEYAGTQFGPTNSNSTDKQQDSEDSSLEEEEGGYDSSTDSSSHSHFPAERSSKQGARSFHPPQREGWTSREDGRATRILYVTRRDPPAGLHPHYRPPVAAPVLPPQAQQDHRPLPVPRRPQQMQWNQRIHQLSLFKKQFGHCHVTTISIETNKREHIDLALWLAEMRHNHRKGTLSNDRSHILHHFFGVPGFEPRLRGDSNDLGGSTGSDVSHSTPPEATAIENHYHQIRTMSEKGRSSWESTPAGHHPASYHHGAPAPNPRMQPKHLPRGHKDVPPPPTHGYGAYYPPRGEDFAYYHHPPHYHPYHPHQQQRTPPPPPAHRAPPLAPVPQQLHHEGANDVSVPTDNKVEETKKSRKRGQYIGWHERLEQLIQFRKKRGHCDARIVLHDDEESKELGRWLASQRHQYKKGKLPRDKVEILQNLGVQLTFKKNTNNQSGSSISST